MAMKLHSPEVLRLHRLLWGHHEQELADIKELQSLHLEVSEQAQKREETERSDLMLDGDDCPLDLLVERGCPTCPSPLEALDQQTAIVFLEDQFGSTFSKKFLNILMEWHLDADHLKYKISFLELAIFLANDGAGWTPSPHSTVPGQWNDRSVMNFSEPTIAALVRLTKAFFRALNRGSLIVCDWCKGINLANFGVHPPQDGLILAVPVKVAESIATALLRFTKRRPVRRANDLSRPFRISA